MHVRRRELFILVLGDLTFFLVALYITLFVRYFELPTRVRLEDHLPAFTFLSAVWLAVYFIAGLYDKHTVILQRRLPGRIFTAQTINVLCAAALFFLLPIFPIAPKTNLLIYLGVSSLLMVAWRLTLFPHFRPRKRYKALLLAEGQEAEELVREVNGNYRYEYEFVRIVDYALVERTPDFVARTLEVVKNQDISIIVASPYTPKLANLIAALVEYSFGTRRLTFIDFESAYEELFDRVPLSALRFEWFLQHLTSSSDGLYRVAKRCADIMLSVPLGVLFILCLPLVMIMIKLDDGGSVFISQRRLGENGKVLKVYKLRTMSENDKGYWQGEGSNKVTRVGRFLRFTSLDELPQLWNILWGNMSLIGPRNDIESLGVRLLEHVPFYRARYAVPPGITGWAQTHQQYLSGHISPQSIEESKVRLAYDLYYVKNRSMLLDLAIIFRTIKTLLVRVAAHFRVG